MVLKTQYNIEFDLPNVIETIHNYVSLYDPVFLESVSVLRLNETINYYGICEHVSGSNSNEELVPKFRIRCAINDSIVYPITVPDDDMLFDSSIFSTENTSKQVTVNNCSELCIWLVGRTVYDYLNSIDQTQSLDTTAEAFALDWLFNWRNNH